MSRYLVLKPLAILVAFLGVVACGLGAGGATDSGQPRKLEVFLHEVRGDAPSRWAGATCGGTDSLGRIQIQIRALGPARYCWNSTEYKELKSTGYTELFRRVLQASAGDVEVHVVAQDVAAFQLYPLLAEASSAAKQAGAELRIVHALIFVDRKLFMPQRKSP